MKNIFLYDTTLRDGTQGEDVSFSVEDKLRVARLLDDFGVHYIEGGWPGSNPRDLEFFNRAKELKLKHAKIAAFGSTRRPKNNVAEDPNLQALIEAETPVVTIFGKTWLLHVKHALQITESENLAVIEESVAYLKSKGKEVVYDAEHFFDGFKGSREYALQTLAAAERGGADVIVLCDTNGGTMPDEVSAIVRDVKQQVNVPLGIHTHNDSEVAVANTLAAVKEGAVHVQGTINGYGERCGNANLCAIIPNLQLKLGHSCVSEEKLKKLTGLALAVSELANLAPRKHLAYVGASAFAHKGGVHVSAVMKTPETYEHIAPEVVGNQRRVLVSDLSGRSNVVYKAQELGIDLQGNTKAAQEIVEDIKLKEFNGYQYEDADGSLELLIKRRAQEWKEFFELEGFKVIIHKEAKEAYPVSEALIKVRVGNEIEHTAAEGNGPVAALDNALRKALEKFYPALKNMQLADYKVRVLDGQDGTSAKVRVLITTKNGQGAWNTVGVSTNIIEASWKALVDSVYYHLLKTGADGVTKERSNSHDPITITYVR
ncbi:MAG: citramalate synthase [Ignavibacteriae bacterium]|nr:citramalate synthase [Ignavibacteriota bacterium]